MTRATDVVVVGAGAAGLTAAFAAAQAGALVTLVERDDGKTSNLAVSGGLIAAAGTRAQKSGGVDDTPEIWASDIAEATGGVLPEGLVEAVTRNAAEAIAIIEVATGERFTLVGDVRFPGHSRQRLHELGGRSGTTLAALLMERAATTPQITIHAGCAVTEIIVEDGAARGVRIARDGATSDIRAKAVILSSGGFGANPDMVRRHMPEMAEAFYIGAPSNTGDAFGWAETLGATPAFMSGYQGHGHATLDGMGRLGAGVTSVGAMIVDRSGRRFVREDISPSALAGFVAARDGALGIEIYSQAMHDAFLRFAPYREAMERGGVRRFDDLASLCEAFGVDAGELAGTLAEFNAMARGETTDPLGRVDFGGEITAPFWAVGVTGALVHTQGGLRVDERARVVRDDGRAIDGLYAAGGCALGITGVSPAGYLPGHGLGQSVALGALAGRDAAARARP
ncbi:MAG: FAD-dependent oxidoreductase [Microvirga sp.]|nr:FAD-dependent oxidoreductase [Microvirga sp.]